MIIIIKMEAAIIRRKGIDDLVSGYSSKKVEEENEQYIRENPSSFLSLLKDTINCRGTRKVMLALREVDEIFSPDKIDSFLQLPMSHPDKTWYRYCKGLLVSRLVQNSYDSGRNDFILHTEEALDYLGKVRASPDRPLLLEVHGKVGSSFCSGENIHAHLYGDGNSCNGARNSIITIHGYMDACGTYSSGTTFRTSNRRTLNRMLRYVFDKQITGETSEPFSERISSPSGNRIIFIYPDGEEEAIADYT